MHRVIIWIPNDVMEKHKGMIEKVLDEANVNLCHINEDIEMTNTYSNGG